MDQTRQMLFSFDKMLIDKQNDRQTDAHWQKQTDRQKQMDRQRDGQKNFDIYKDSQLCIYMY